MEGNMKLKVLSNQLRGRTIADSLGILVDEFPGKVLFTTSLGIEDQVITHIIFENKIPLEVATLDTGRLFPETYKVLNETMKKYQKKVNVYFPAYEDVETMVTEKGPFSFYYSKENRLECCRLRKVFPLKRALEGKECWISGIRAGQSDSRSKMTWLEFEEERQLFKFYPLFDWSSDDVRNFIAENHVPYNILHNKGFVSIGCEPCTRAVKEGGDFRSGRWWWEKDDQKECGCHIK